MSTTKQRLTVTLDDDLYKELEDFRFENRFESKSEAMTFLIRSGLDAHNGKGGNDNHG